MVAGSLRRTSKTLLALVLGAAFTLPARAALTWQPQGPAFQVNSYALSDQLHPAVATDADGNFVVLWIDKLRGLFLRRFDATGAPLTPEIRVDDPPIPAAWLARQQAHGLTADTGAFWFFGPANLELMVKVLDGRPVNGRFWVFFGALSDVGYTLTVTDTQTGKQKAYRNDPGTLASRADTSAF